ncbi:hypothetical protein [Flavobacterium sp. SM2513]|uniref:hypothetical protein n=1 Tax=Flavobacterium sp. SM2513 TaxID=3424766 RepID=UPI003D7F87DE
MRKHTKKTYYSAGLISIILLPLLCVLHLQNIKAFTQYTAMDVRMWDGTVDTAIDSALVEHVNSKKYTVVHLTGNNASDKRKLVDAQNKVRNITASKDSIHGIKFHFGPKSEYWTYVRVIDIMAMEKVKFYVNYKDDIWFANPKPEKVNKNTLSITPLTCGYGYYHRYEKEALSWTEVKQNIQKYYLPILAYLLMLGFTVIRIYKLNRNTT